MSCPQTRDVGPLVLDLLEPQEAARLEVHVRDCPECSEALADLRPVAVLMDRADPPTAGPDDLAFMRFRAAARTRRRRTPWLVAAAAVLLLVVGTVTAVAVQRHPPGTTVVAASGQVHAEVSLRPQSSGTRLELRIRGVDPGQRCQLVAVSLDGHREVAGSWSVGYSGTATITGGVSIKRADISRLLVETLDGRSLVMMRLT